MIKTINVDVKSVESHMHCGYGYLEDVLPNNVSRYIKQGNIPCIQTQNKILGLEEADCVEHFQGISVINWQISNKNDIFKECHVNTIPKELIENCLGYINNPFDLYYEIVANNGQGCGEASHFNINGSNFCCRKKEAFKFYFNDKINLDYFLRRFGFGTYEETSSGFYFDYYSNEMWGTEIMTGDERFHFIKQIKSNCPKFNDDCFKSRIEIYFPPEANDIYKSSICQTFGEIHYIEDNKCIMKTIDKKYMEKKGAFQKRELAFNDLSISFKDKKASVVSGKYFLREYEQYWVYYSFKKYINNH
jgi:hypothetical protein